MKCKVYRSTTPGRKWHYRIVASNGKIVAQGEGYNRIGDVLKTLKSMFKAGPKLLSQAEAMIAAHLTGEKPRGHTPPKKLPPDRG